MKFAPFLLQAFAARVLATKTEETISRADLASQGYDVETLVSMIESYAALPDDDRGFIVSATDTAIHIRRKIPTRAPLAPDRASTAPAPTVQSEKRPPLPGAKIKLSDVVNRGDKGNRPPPKS